MANVTRYDPFGDLVDDFLKGFFVRPITAEGATGAPRLKVEVSEQAEAFKVQAEIPGVKKDEIQVAIDGDQVSITAEVRKERDVKDGERVIHRVEGDREVRRRRARARPAEEEDPERAAAEHPVSGAGGESKGRPIGPPFPLLAAGRPAIESGPCPSPPPLPPRRPRSSPRRCRTSAASTARRSS
jgi:HSP20 family protein